MLVSTIVVEAKYIFTAHQLWMLLQSASSSFSNAWTGVVISTLVVVVVYDVGVQLSGSIMEYRHWTETLNTSSFKNHIANPKAYDGNSVSSSYENLVLRYSFDDNKNLLRFRRY